MPESSRQRVERLASRLRLFVWGIIFATVAIYIAARVGVEIGKFRLVTQGAVEGVSRTLSLFQDIGAALVVVALWQLSKMLGHIGRGEPFSGATTRHFRRFALFIFLAAAVAFFGPPAVAIALNEPGPEPLRLLLKIKDLWIMLLTGVLLLVAALLDEAQRVESELREIV